MDQETVFIVLFIFYSTPTRFRELDARETLSLRNQLRIAVACALFPLREKRCCYLNSRSPAVNLGPFRTNAFLGASFLSIIAGRYLMTPR